jgi:hypothetical protein
MRLAASRAADDALVDEKSLNNVGTLKTSFAAIRNGRCYSAWELARRHGTGHGQPTRSVTSP